MTSNTHPADETRGPAVLAVTVIFTVVSTVFVILRIISRLVVVRIWRWDDWCIMLAWVLAVSFSVSICLGVRYGLGLHEAYIPPEDGPQLRKTQYAFSVLYNPALMATKTSIALFYISLSDGQQLFKRGTYATMAVVNLAGLALTFLNIFQCHPVWAIFQNSLPGDTVCTDLIALYLSSAPVNIITDLALLLLPMPMLTGMRMPKKQKIVLVVTFGFGVFVAAVDVVRIAYLQQGFQTRLTEVSRGNAITSSALENNDFAWYAAFSFMWSAIEVHVGIICASVPSLKPLVASVLPKMIYDTASQEEATTFRRRRLSPLFRKKTETSGEKLASPRSGPKSPLYLNKVKGGGLQHGLDGQPLSPASYTFSDVRSDTNSKPLHTQLEQPPSAYGSRPNGSAHRPSAPPPIVVKTEDQGDDGGEIGFMEFLTTPSDLHSPMTHQTTINTLDTVSAANNNAKFFDFYNIGDSKPMTTLSDRESLLPVALVTILFFLWGFAYGLLEQLNVQFQVAAGLDAGQAVGLHAVYFAAYFIAPPTIGAFVLQRAGFKAVFICGLCIYATGTLTFWPSAVLLSYPAFMVSNFIVACGVSVLEVAANPFIALCGPQRHAETRLNLSQGVQAIGTALAPLLAQKVLFKNADSGSGLIDVEWAYLAIALFDVALAVVFYYLPIPEASGADFAKVTDQQVAVSRRNPIMFSKYKVAYVSLAVGVSSMFFYVGAQEAVAGNYTPYIDQIAAVTGRLQPFDWLTVGYSAFAVGRFLTAAACIFLQPRIILGVLYVGMIVTCALSLRLEGTAGAATLVIYELFQGGVFPLVFAISLRGLGRHTKMGAVLLSMATGGGAVVPLFAYPVNNAQGFQIGLAVALAAACTATLYAVYLNFVPSVRKLVDPLKKDEIDGAAELPSHENRADGVGNGHSPANGLANGLANGHVNGKKKEGELPNVPELPEFQTGTSTVSRDAG